MTAQTDQPLVRCVGITQFFGGVRALASVSVDFYAGEVVGIVGENGAGKTTLTRVLSGLNSPDRGEIFFGSERFTSLTPSRSKAFGVETVYQNLLLCDNLTAPQNVLLGQEPKRWRIGPISWVDRRKSERVAAECLRELGAKIPDMTTPVRRLSGGQRQAIAIARATMRGHRLMIFDEPTAALGVRQTAATLDLIRRVAGQGVAVVLISHNVEEVLAVADRVVALRLGQVIFDGACEGLTRDQVEDFMAGRATTELGGSSDDAS